LSKVLAKHRSWKSSSEALVRQFLILTKVPTADSRQRYWHSAEHCGSVNDLFTN